jgi:sarcosine oxidase subunit alpha
MSAAAVRVPQHGRVDRARPIAFRFNGRSLAGFAGDTLASALLANRIGVVARSFKYHRPRGVMTAGAEEPNALVQLGEGDRSEPNARATQVTLVEGLSASSQNCWPSVDFDLAATANLLGSLIPAGFYYKTFIWPRGGWLFYEQLIRRAAGMGRAPTLPDPDRYDHRYVHCDILIVGGGPAGLTAALAASATGADTVIVDENPVLGGTLLYVGSVIDRAPAADWLAEIERTLADRSNVSILRAATAFGYYDHNLIGVVERDLGKHPAAGIEARQRLSMIRAAEVILATGAIERPICFGNNDRPGVMLAAAALRYLNEYGVRVACQPAIFTNNDTAYRTAIDLADAGARVQAIVDVRSSPASTWTERARARGIDVRTGAVIASALGTTQIRGAVLAPIGQPGSMQEIACDAILVSGGFDPAVHLFSQSRGTLRWSDELAAFLPDRSPQAVATVGACNGTMDLDAQLNEAYRAGARAAERTGFKGAAGPPPRAESVPAAPLQVLWDIAAMHHRGGKRFVDFQNDVTADDIGLAVREGFRSVEHVKRYTTLGMGTDQGKTGNIVGAGVLAATTLSAVAGLGTTTFRPPYTPVTFGAFAGFEINEHLDPIRRTPLHALHQAAGAIFVNAGQWRRTQLFPREGKSDIEAIDAEVVAVRNNVAITDVSTLGKIEVVGADAVEFLNRMYINSFDKLPIGRCRYAVMLREDGMVFDDGTVSRIDGSRFLVTTTTANAARVLAKMEYYLQVEWPQLRVFVAAVTDHWGAIALAGPRARDVLACTEPSFDTSNVGLPHLGMCEGRLWKISVRVLRVSFSGELCYEIYAPSFHAAEVWRRLIEAGRPFGIAPYGTEAMGILRIEKGHFVVGPEADGRTTADDLGLARMISVAKECVGSRSLARPALRDPLRKQLVGIMPAERTQTIPRGAHIVSKPPPAGAITESEGQITSACVSPTLGHSVALALVRAGRARFGEKLYAASPLAGATVPVEIVAHTFYDPQGKRLHG